MRSISRWDVNQFFSLSPASSFSAHIRDRHIDISIRDVEFGIHFYSLANFLQFFLISLPWIFLFICKNSKLHVAAVHCVYVWLCCVTATFCRCYSIMLFLLWQNDDDDDRYCVWVASIRSSCILHHQLASFSRTENQESRMRIGDEFGRLDMMEWNGIE